MKLVYIAHGFWLGVKGQPLIQERIEAWKYGPVVPTLYQITKRFGRDPIPFDLIEDEDRHGLPDEVKAFLEQVVEKYGHLSGYRLSTITHETGSPWSQVYQSNAMGIEIPNTVIRPYYERLMQHAH